jgi:hypothetical protein
MMTNMTIHPTHHCFDDALEYIVARVKREPALARDATLQLVHGIVHFPDDQPAAGKLFAHAWVEEHGQVWNAGILDGVGIWYAVERSEWYAAMRVVKTTKYSIRQAYLENLRTRTYGPWAPEYQALCLR